MLGSLLLCSMSICTYFSHLLSFESQVMNLLSTVVHIEHTVNSM